MNHFSLKPLVLTLCFCISTLALSQTSTPRFRSELTGAYLLGFEVYNSNFLFRPGHTVNFAHSYKINKYVNCGLGAGVMKLDDENFYPLYANVLALRSKKSVDKFVRCNVGYSLAHSKVISKMDNYDLRGGGFFKFGVGRTYPLNKTLALSTEFSYLHQNAKLDFTNYNSVVYSEVLNYSFFQLSLGLVFNYRPYDD